MKVIVIYWICIIFNTLTYGIQVQGLGSGQNHQVSIDIKTTVNKPLKPTWNEFYWAPGIFDESKLTTEEPEIYGEYNQLENELVTLLQDFRKNISLKTDEVTKKITDFYKATLSVKEKDDCKNSVENNLSKLAQTFIEYLFECPYRTVEPIETIIEMIRKYRDDFETTKPQEICENIITPEDKVNCLAGSTPSDKKKYNLIFSKELIRNAKGYASNYYNLYQKQCCDEVIIKLNYYSSITHCEGSSYPSYIS